MSFDSVCGDTVIATSQVKLISWSFSVEPTAIVILWLVADSDNI